MIAVTLHYWYIVFYYTYGIQYITRHFKVTSYPIEDEDEDEDSSERTPLHYRLPPVLVLYHLHGIPEMNFKVLMFFNLSQLKS